MMYIARKPTSIPPPPRSRSHVAAATPSPPVPPWAMICTWTYVLPAIRFTPASRNWSTRPAASTNSVRNTAILRKNNRSPVADDSARASSEGALARFASLSRLLWFVLVLHGGGAAAECGVDRVDAEVTVARVYAGDTVRLNDGRHLRLIGLEAPELGRDGAAAEP